MESGKGLINKLYNYKMSELEGTSNNLAKELILQIRKLRHKSDLSYLEGTDY